MAPRSALAALTLASALVLAGCAEATDGTPAPSTASSSTGTPTTQTTEAPAGTTVEITLEGGTYDPQGKTVKVPLGEPVTLEITADAEDELHVHSDPEATVAFGVGTTTKTLTFDTPGVIEVESHGTGVVVLQLQVS